LFNTKVCPKSNSNFSVPKNGGLKKHVFIKFCFRLAKNAMETFATLQVALKSKQWEEKSFYAVS